MGRATKNSAGTTRQYSSGNVDNLFPGIRIQHEFSLPFYAVFPMEKGVSNPQERRHESALDAKNKTIECNEDNSNWRITRRGFVESAGMLTGGLALGIPLRGASAEKTASCASIPGQVERRKDFAFLRRGSAESRPKPGRI
jgi:hypothetical protein